MLLLVIRCEKEAMKLRLSWLKFCILYDKSMR